MKEYTWITPYIYPFVLLTVEGVKHCWTLYMFLYISVHKL